MNILGSLFAAIASIALGQERIGEDMDTTDSVTLHERMRNLSEIYVKSRADVVRDREFRETAVGWNPGGWEEVEGETPSGNREFSRVTKEKGQRK